MKKATVQSVKNSLKFKAEEKSGVLSVRVGVKKYTLPCNVRMLASEDYLFLSFPASSEIYKVGLEGLHAMPKDAEAADVYADLNPKRTRGTKRNASAELPVELASALSKIPAGYKLGYGPDGSVRLVRSRNRKPKA